MVVEFKKGSIVEGKVTRIVDFGAFIQLKGINRDGLLHISEIDDKYIEDINDYLSKGDQIRVKIIDIKSGGKIDLSWKTVPEEKRLVKKGKKENESEYLPADTKKTLSNGVTIDNFYLLANKFLDRFESETKFDTSQIHKNLAKYSNRVFTNEVIQKTLKKKHVILQDLKESGYNIEQFDFTNDYRLIFGLGGANVLETNLFLHHIYGIPYLPGSALKGVTRSWVIELLHNDTGKSYEDIVNLLEKEKLTKEDKLIKKIQLYRQIFGNTNESGKVIFMDAYPKSKINLTVDIMTPHFSSYYKEIEDNEKKEVWPIDTEEPTPITFLVLEGTTFSFSLISNELNAEEYLNETRELMKSALENLGIGAKTMVGYGYFEEVLE